MSIQITEILGTDSLSGSRITINKNFSTITSEINRIERYINPTTGVLSNLTAITSESIKIGADSLKAEISTSKIEFYTNTTFKNGIIRLDGSKIMFNSTNPQILDDSFAGAGLSIDIGSSSTIPTYTNNRVNNTNTAGLTINLFEGEIGQEIDFVYSGTGGGDVNIIAGGTADMVLPAGASIITLNAQGETVRLKAYNDGTGNPDWYIVGGSSYTLS